jgi:hypothetical protein
MRLIWVCLTDKHSLFKALFGWKAEIMQSAVSERAFYVIISDKVYFEVLQEGGFHDKILYGM